MSSKNLMLVVTILCAFGAVIDGMFTGTVLAAMIQPRNIITGAFVIAGGLFINVLVVLTRPIWVTIRFIPLRILWFVALAIDAFTTIYGTIFYVIMGMPLSQAIDFTKIRFEPSNFFPSALAFGITGLITGASVMCLYLYEKYQGESKPPTYGKKGY